MTLRLGRIAYRLTQLRSSLSATLQSEDRAWVDSVLSGAERPLFHRMPGYDKSHSVRIARELGRSGQASDLLLRAALLHDCGKTIPPHGIPLLYRGGVVVLGAISQRLLTGLALPHWPFLPVYLHLHHPELGARALRDAGSPDALVQLVRQHQSISADPLLQRLQRADARH